MEPTGEQDEAHVVLVDEDDRETGTMGKMGAHRTGALHRAFSVFIFSSEGMVLLQQRAKDKYHSAGLWSNACCSHQQPGEATIDAARRRVREELGLRIEPEGQFCFRYHASFANGLVENELDHVLFATTDERPALAPAEVQGVRWTSMAQLTRDLLERPEEFTFWLKECWPLVVERRRGQA